MIDGWFQLVPAGMSRTSGTGRVEVIDQLAVATLARSFQRDASRWPKWDGMPIFFGDKHLGASGGWIMKVLDHGDGLYGLIYWTSSGIEALQDGHPRLLNVWFSAWEPISPGRYRPTRLESMHLMADGEAGVEVISNKIKELIV